MISAPSGRPTVSTQHLILFVSHQKISRPMDTTEALKKQLSDLTVKHRQLDDEITELLDMPPFDQVEIQRLKKRKLVLKDEILQIQNRLLPDIIA